jgi:hypothetical protein
MNQPPDFCKQCFGWSETDSDGLASTSPNGG